MRCIALWLIAGALLACLAETAFARDLDGRYAGSALSDWYKAQVNQVGALCCDDADGHEVVDWGRGPAGYWVEFDGKRHDVPANAIVNGAHPQGKAVVWIYPKGTDVVRCFMPGMEG
jgi:hypothetical protein